MFEAACIYSPDLGDTKHVEQQLVFTVGDRQEADFVRLIGIAQGIAELAHSFDHTSPAKWFKTGRGAGARLVLIVPLTNPRDDWRAGFWFAGEVPLSGCALPPEALYRHIQLAYEHWRFLHGPPRAQWPDLTRAALPELCAVVAPRAVRIAAGTLSPTARAGIEAVRQRAGALDVVITSAEDGAAVWPGAHLDIDARIGIQRWLARRAPRTADAEGLPVNAADLRTPQGTAGTALGRHSASQSTEPEAADQTGQTEQTEQTGQTGPDLSTAESDSPTEIDSPTDSKPAQDTASDQTSADSPRPDAADPPQPGRTAPTKSVYLPEWPAGAATEAATELATEPGTEPGTEQATEQAAEPATEQATEQAAEPGTEQATEPGTEPAAEQGTESSEPVETAKQSPQTSSWFSMPGLSALPSMPSVSMPVSIPSMSMSMPSMSMPASVTSMSANSYIPTALRRWWDAEPERAEEDPADEQGFVCTDFEVYDAAAHRPLYVTAFRRALFTYFLVFSEPAAADDAALKALTSHFEALVAQLEGFSFAFAPPTRFSYLLLNAAQRTVTSTFPSTLSTEILSTLLAPPTQRPQVVRVGPTWLYFVTLRDGTEAVFGKKALSSQPGSLLGALHNDVHQWLSEYERRL